MVENLMSARSACRRAASIVTSRVSDPSGGTSVTERTSAKRSNSVHGSTEASPRTPCALRITPRAMRSLMTRSVQDVEGVPPARLLAGGGEESADGPRRAALAPDHFAEVGRGHFARADRGLLPLHGVHFHRIRIVDERLGHELDQVFHGGVVSCQLSGQ